MRECAPRGDAGTRRGEVIWGLAVFEMGAACRSFWADSARMVGRVRRAEEGRCTGS